MVTPATKVPSVLPNFSTAGSDVAHAAQLVIDPAALVGGLVGGEFRRWRAALTIASTAASAAIMPVFIAVWLPLMRGTLTKPAEHPISAPPGKVSFGTDCQPPSLIARAP